MQYSCGCHQCEASCCGWHYIMVHHRILFTNMQIAGLTPKKSKKVQTEKNSSLYTFLILLCYFFFSWKLTKYFVIKQLSCRKQTCCEHNLPRRVQKEGFARTVEICTSHQSNNWLSLSVGLLGSKWETWHGENKKNLIIEWNVKTQENMKLLNFMVNILFLLNSVLRVIPLHHMGQKPVSHLGVKLGPSNTHKTSMVPKLCSVLLMCRPRSVIT